MKPTHYPHGTRYVCSGEAAAHDAGEGSFIDCKACGEAVRDVLAVETDAGAVCPACAEEEPIAPKTDWLALAVDICGTARGGNTGD